MTRLLLHEIVTFGSTFRNWLNQDRAKPSKAEREEIAELYLANTEVIIGSLENLKGVYNTALINFLQDFCFYFFILYFFYNFVEVCLYK